MGLFKEFKDDFSQAVNELVPGDVPEREVEPKAQTADNLVVDTIGENVDVASELSKLSKICPHFHLSLQSGCDATLARMNRKYTSKEYEDGCIRLRKYFKHPAITTDIIVGFPGEDAKEFALSKEFARRIHFYEMHIFKYSKRQGTRAAVMENQVPEEIKTKRSSELIELGEQMSKEFRDYYIDSVQEVLFEEESQISGVNYYVGYTREYLEVATKSEKNLENELVSGRITGHLTNDVYLMEC